jgi:hypothetical protein
VYGALWRVLPGPWWVRLLLVLALVAAVLTACVLWVFPLVQELLAPQVTVEGT